MADGPTAGDGAAAEAAAPPVLSVRGLSKSFGAARVLVDVDIEVRAAEVTGLIGPNGAGKTTLFNVVAGVETADAGEVLLHGRRIAGFGAAARARLGISRTFQEIRLFDNLTALENVLVGCRDNAGERLVPALFAWGRSRREEKAARRHAEDLLNIVGLADLADRLPGEMSYGQQKRVGIARALAAGMDLLCLDEPAAGLDPQATQDIAELIRSLSTRTGAIMLVEHNLDLVRELCGWLVFLDNGRVVVTGTPEEVLADERVWRAFMGH